MLVIAKPERVAVLTKFAKIGKNRYLTIFSGARDFLLFFVKLIITKPERVPDLTKFAKIAKNHSSDEFLLCSRFFAVLCHVNKHKTTASCGLNKICENYKKSSV